MLLKVHNFCNNTIEMDNEDKEFRAACAALNEHVRQGVAPREMEKVAADLQNELNKSKKISNDIRRFCKSQSEVVIDSHLEAYDDLVLAMTTHSDILFEDMDEKIDLNINDTIAEIKKYAEELIKNCKFTSKTNASVKHMTIEDMKWSDLNLEECASNLDQLLINVTQMKTLLATNPTTRQREDLENSLTKLVDEVEFFTAMGKAQTILSQCSNKYAEDKDKETGNLDDYRKTIEKILDKASEVTYVLSNLKK